MSADGQYDLKVGFDTSTAKAGVESLAADLVKAGKAADVVQDKLDAVSAASSKLATSAKGAGASAASAASSTDKLASAAAKSGAEVSKGSAALSKHSSAAVDAAAASSRAAASVDNFNQVLRAQNLALAQAKNDVLQYHRQVEAASVAKQKATGVANSFRAAIIGIQVAIATLGMGALVRDAVNVALEFDRARKSLVAVTGSQQAAGQEMAFLADESDRLGLVLSRTAVQYGRMAAASKGTVLEGAKTREIFLGVSEAATVLGLSAEQSAGALMGVQQTIAKGKVTAEELVQQIAERLPMAYSAMARSMGISSLELSKRLEQGKVGLENLVGWAQELRKSVAAGLSEAVRSHQANLNRLINLMEQLKKSGGEGFLAGFLAGFSDLKNELTSEELKAAARGLGEGIGKALRAVTDLAVMLAKQLEMVKAVLLVIVSMKVASWFVTLAGAIATATGQTLIFKSALQGLAVAGPLAAIGVALLAVIVVMQQYITTTRLAHEAELSKLARSQDIFGYYATLKANKEGLTEEEARYAQQVRATMEAERAALAVSLARTRAQFEASKTLNPFKYAQVAGPGRNVLGEQVTEQERELKTIDNQLNILDSQWQRLGKLPTIKIPVDAGEADKAGKKLADLLTGFERTAEQAERIRDAQASGGASGVVRETEEIDRQNAAYQALATMEGISAESKERLTAIIEGLVARTQEANRATAEGAAEIARDLAFTAAATEAEAGLADAKSQTSVASREAAIQAEADAIAREFQKEEDADYVAGLITVIRTRKLFLASMAMETAAVERQIAHAATLRQKRAELVDAQTQNTDATRRLAVELEAETLARERGIQVGTIWHGLLLAISAARAQEVANLTEQAAAQRDLNDANEALSRTGREVLQLKEISAIKRSDFRTEREYQQALRDTNTEIKVRSDLLAVQNLQAKALAAVKREAFETEAAYQAELIATTETYDQLAAGTEAATRAQIAYGEAIESNDSTLLTGTQKLSMFADALRSSLTGVSDQIQGIASGIATMIDGFVMAAEAGDDMAAKLQGLASAAAGLYAVADAAGVLNQNVTQGGFGGRGEGNFSAEGSMVGAVIGGIIGAYFGGGAGAQVGMAIGSAAGGVLGAFVKKGAEESLSELNLSSNGIVAAITKDEGSLGRTIVELGSRLDDAINQILDTLGASLDSLPQISVKIRDGVISVWVGAVNARVKEMDEAITFAVTEILKQADISGISDTIRQVLSQTQAMDLDQLARDLDFGQWFEQLGMDDAAVAILNLTGQFRMAVRQARELGLESEKIGLWYTQQLVEIRNGILGIEEDPAERVRRSAEAFNAQILFMRAEQTARRADLASQKAFLEGKVAILKAEIGLGEAELDVQIAFAQAGGQVLDASIQALVTTVDALAAVSAALEAADILLASIGDGLLITQEEIAAAMARARGAGRGAGAGGRNKADEKKDFEGELDDIIRSGMPESIQAVLDLRDQLAEMAAKARDLKISEEKLAAARQVLIDQTKKQILDPVRQYLRPEDGGTYGMSDWDAKRGDIEKTFDEARAANQKLIDETSTRAIAFWKLNEAELRALEALAEEVIDSLGLPIESTRDRVKALRDAVAALRKAVDEGAISTARFEEVIGEMGMMAGSELLNLAADLLDQMGMGDKAAEARRAAEELDFHVKIIQLQILYDSYVALGLISGDLKIRLDGLMGIISDPANWPKFNAPKANVTERNSGGNGANDTPAWKQVWEESKKQAAEWRKSAMGEMTQEAVDLTSRREELIGKIEAERSAGDRAGWVGWADVAISELQAAYQTQVRTFVDEALEGFERVPQVVSAARDLRERLDDVQAAFQELNVTAEDAARAEAARQEAIAGFVDDSLADYERLGKNPLAAELEDINREFADIRTAFETIGATADQMARLEEARALVLADFWDRATEGIQGLIEQLKAEDPRITSQERFVDARSDFRDLLARAQGGDLEAVEQLQAAASLYREQAQAFLGGGVGSQGVLDEILAGLEGVVAMDPEDAVFDRLGDTNDLLAQIRDGVAAWYGGAEGTAQRTAEDYGAAASAYAAAAASQGDTHTAGSTPEPPSPRSSTGASDSTSVEAVALLRQLAEAERRKLKAAEEQAIKDRYQTTSESARAEMLLTALAALGTKFDNLARVIENKSPAGTN